MSDNSIAIHQDPDSPATSIYNAALKNILAGVQDLIQTESLTVTEIKAEATGEHEYNPFVDYQTQKELLDYMIGVLSKVRHAYELDERFTGYLIDKMLPTGDTGEGVNKL